MTETGARILKSMKGVFTGEEEKGEDGPEKTAEQEALLAKVAAREAVELVVFLRDRAGVYFNLQEGYTVRAEELLELVIEEQGLPPEARESFSVWFVSPILDVRLKGHHQPFQILAQWDQLCCLYSDASNKEISEAEPVLMVQRDVFFPKEQEVLVTNEQMLCLLYHEAKYNVVQGRYPMYSDDYHRLAGLQALIHLGKYSTTTHVLADYRANLVQFYPEHMYVKEKFLFFARAGPQKPDCEALFMESHKRASEEYGDRTVDQSLSGLYRRYLEICWAYPFYGAAFFSGEVETPCGRFKKTFLPALDTEVIVAINTECVTVVDREKCETLLSVPYSQLSWEFRDPDFDGDNDPPPVLLLQFLAQGKEAEADYQGDDAEGGAGGPVTKLLKVVAREAKLMDALVETCVQRKLYQRQRSAQGDVVDSALFDSGQHRLANKLERLCLSTYTRDGEVLDVKT